MAPSEAHGKPRSLAPLRGREGTVIIGIGIRIVVIIIVVMKIVEIIVAIVVILVVIIVRLTEILLPRIARQGTACLISILFV